MAGTIAATPPPTDTAARGLPWWANPRVGLAALIVGLFVLFSALRPSFLNVNLTLVPLQADLAVFVVVGLAQMSVLSLGHMNLALGRMAALSAFASGFVYDRFDVPLLAGLAPAGMEELRSDTFSDYCIGNVCGPPVPLIVPFALVAVVVVGILFRVTLAGRAILMTGSNIRAARLSGIRVERRIIQAHTLSGVLAALAGFLLAMNNGAFSATIGNQFLLPSFLAPVLGGTLLAGGAVSVIGTVLGATLTSVIQKGLNLLQFELSQLQIFIGVVLLAALSLDRVRHLLAERRGVRR